MMIIIFWEMIIIIVTAVETSNLTYIFHLHCWKSKPSTRPAETGLTYSSNHKMEATNLFLSKARLAPNYMDF
jgi:hypothetical protein